MSLLIIIGYSEEREQIGEGCEGDGEAGRHNAQQADQGVVHHEADQQRGAHQDGVDKGKDHDSGGGGPTQSRLLQPFFIRSCSQLQTLEE